MKTTTRKGISAVTGLALLLCLGAAGCRAGRPAPGAGPLPARAPAAADAAGEQFAFELWERIRAAEDEGANIFISPYSIHTACLVAALGAGGRTRAEAAAALGFDDFETEAVGSRARALRRHLESFRETRIEIANALFLKPDFPFRPDYLETVRRFFDAELDALPALTDPVNRWVARKTGGLIEEILEPGRPIDADVIMLLLNAVYFRGYWREAFDPGQTRDDTFTGRTGREASVRMMEATGEYHWLEADGYRALALPYRDEDLRLLVFLPGSFDGFERRFGAGLVREVRERLRPRRVRLQMPRFRIEYECNLTRPLRQAGLGLFFDPARADFSRLVALEKLGGENVFISDARHKAFIDVDEEGTEAAAVTSLEFRVTAMPDPLPLVRLDRPFYFLIEEKTTGTVLFLGRVVDL